MAMVPLALALIAAAGMVGRDEEAVGRVARALDPIAPDGVIDFITALLRDAEVGTGASWWVIGLALVVSLGLGSRAVVALQRALAAASGQIEVRPPFQLRAVAIVLTAAGGVSLLLASTLLVAGHGVFAFVAAWTGQAAVLDFWAWLRIPVTALALFGFLLACYRFGPPQPVERPAVAAGIATAGVVAGSLAFGFYLGWAPALGATFGALGTVAVLLVWLHLGAMAILAGAVLAAAPSDE